MEAGVNFPGAHNPGTMQAPYWGKTANNGASGKKEANRAGDRGEKGTFRCLFPSRSQLNSICRSPICLRINNIKCSISRFMHFDPSTMFQHFNLVPAPFSKGKSPRNEVVLYLLFYYCLVESDFENHRRNRSLRGRHFRFLYNKI